MSSKQSAGMRRGPMGHGRGPAEKAKDFRGTMAKLIRYLGSYRINIIIAFLFSIFSVALMVIGPKILGNATTELTNGFMAKIYGTGSIDFGKIETILLQLIGLYLISTLCGFIQSWMMAGVAQKVAYQLRAEMAHKVDLLPFSYFDRQSHGEVLSRFSNDVDMIQQTMNQSLGQLISSFVQIIGYLVMMLSISFTMTLLALIVVPLSLILVTTVVKHSQKYFAAQQSSLGEVNGHIEEMYGAHMIMKAFNGEAKSVQTFDQLNDQLYDSAWKSQFLSGLMQPISTFVGNLGYVGVAILGGYLAMNGSITIGDIQSFITYVRSFNQPISMIAQNMNILQSTAAAAERVFAFLEEEEEVPECEDPVEIFDADGHTDIQGQVTFENVHFGYRPDKIIIHDFSMYIKPGRKIAIVGPTGAGKTTIIKLLMRFYELNSGTIYIDGIPTTQMRHRDLRALFGMVLQDAWLFSGTVMENLRYGRPDATDEEVIRAADAAYVDHFIRTLDHGYQTVINEESSNISQGQKQLLTIARAFLADPKILILDEATSSVDTRTEVLIQKGMQKLMENRTSFVIAHRLSTIRDADLILVMKDGDIIEAGSHDELMKADGFYTQLYNSQFDEEEE
ncbi:MAG TPA: ABC transporter ATP-binding protein/permease [Candidatus Merdibacter merdavium]|uniref:ABC transporter ATP-binding protein/permease n=1 Tax=Candidatus Merdibacter merdavium TaxID=2838692 RepID=A0A9D2SW34_9FIRM|nr:ABC transporter ATP-binding protein/permease [Candidatus Merdibacter merdavium]